MAVREEKNNRTSEHNRGKISLVCFRQRSQMSNYIPFGWDTDSEKYSVRWFNLPVHTKEIEFSLSFSQGLLDAHRHQAHHHSLSANTLSSLLVQHKSITQLQTQCIREAVRWIPPPNQQSKYNIIIYSLIGWKRNWKLSLFWKNKPGAHLFFYWKSNYLWEFFLNFYARWKTVVFV